MKKLVLIFAIAEAFIQAHAQKKIIAKDVPAVVTSAFKSAHLSVTNVNWKLKDRTNYEAEYKEDKTDMSVTYDASGKLVETEVEIAASELPASAMKFVKKTYEGDEIREVSKITDADAIITYEVEVDKMDLFFDTKGNLIKSIKRKRDMASRTSK